MLKFLFYLESRSKRRKEDAPRALSLVVIAVLVLRMMGLG
jgi:hypothetical protein